MAAPVGFAMSDELRNARWDGYVVECELTTRRTSYGTWEEYIRLEVRTGYPLGGYGPPESIYVAWERNMGKPPLRGEKVSVRCTEAWGYRSQRQELEFIGGTASWGPYFAARYVIDGLWAIDAPSVASLLVDTESDAPIIVEESAP